MADVVILEEVNDATSAWVQYDAGRRGPGDFRDLARFWDRPSVARGLAVMNLRWVSVGRHSHIFLVAALLMLVSGGLRAEQGDETWWSITPYIWAMDTQLDLSWRDSPIGGTEIDFKDALDQLDAAFQVAVEGGRGRWSAFADLTFVKISDAVGEDPLRLKSKNKQVFLDAAVSFWPGGVGTPLSVYGGMRYHGFDNVYRLQNQGSDI
ncbi:MAG: hypothetical protein ACO2YV_14215, partial [Pseudomonadales bacterium]